MHLIQVGAVHKTQNAFAQPSARSDAVFPNECERLLATFVVKHAGRLSRCVILQPCDANHFVALTTGGKTDLNNLPT
jgi:hypothetical protein